MTFAVYITRSCILEQGLKDWTDLLAALESSGIRYLVVGGVAVGYHSVPRYTKVLDILVHHAPPEQDILFECLLAFGAPMHLVRPGEFLQEDFVFHFGVPPWRVDILTSIPGVDFEAAYADRVLIRLGEREFSCISREWLIEAKRASGRPVDLIDLENLQDPPKFTP